MKPTQSRGIRLLRSIRAPLFIRNEAGKSLHLRLSRPIWAPDLITRRLFEYQTEFFTSDHFLNALDEPPEHVTPSATKTTAENTDLCGRRGGVLLPCKMVVRCM